MYIYIHTYIWFYVFIIVCVYIYIYIYIHICIYIYIYIYIQLCDWYKASDLAAGAHVVDVEVDLGAAHNELMYIYIYMHMCIYIYIYTINAYYVLLSFFFSFGPGMFLMTYVYALTYVLCLFGSRAEVSHSSGARQEHGARRVRHDT